MEVACRLFENSEPSLQLFCKLKINPKKVYFKKKSVDDCSQQLHQVSGQCFPEPIRENNSPGTIQLREAEGLPQAELG